MYKNTTAFKSWLDQHMKRPYDLDAVLADVESQYGNCGNPVYELRGYETKSGNPEIYSYIVDIDTDEFDNITVTYIF
jgi:hypothetical protein